MTEIKNFYYTINNTELTRKDVDHSKVVKFDRSINQKFSVKSLITPLHIP